MKPTKQTILHDPAKGLHGNCLSAVLGKSEKTIRTHRDKAFASLMLRLQRKGKM